MFEEIFLRKKPNFDKVINYGFQKNKNNYTYTTNILDDSFELHICINKNGSINTHLVEVESGEEYVLYKTDAQGSFVGDVRMAIEKALRSISEKCYEVSVFQAEQSKAIIAYVREKYGDELEFLWEKFPDNAVWRRRDNKKWYGAILTVQKKKLGISSDETVEIVDLRAKPENIEKFVDSKTYFPGWHMNKKHWYTIILDNTVPFEEICKKLDESYLLAKK